nr:unnamed protein product [Digitaria exilis]
MASRSGSRSRVVAVLLLLLHAAISLSTTTPGTVRVNEEPIADGLSWGFYNDSCPWVEDIVRWYVTEAGCDASVLLSGPKSAQLEVPNQTLRPEALKLIDDIRGALSDACGGPTVSCADITMLATRDAVAASGGPLFDVPLGRRDGLAPASSDLVGTLPAPVFDVPTLLEAFSNRSLDTADLVALSGAHTVGRGHCPSFSDRLPLNADMDPALRQKLAAKCGKDPNAEQGLFTSDQGFINHPATKRIATRFALNQAAFFDQFATSMLKMSQMDVLTGNNGEIRLNCALTNAASGIIVKTTADEGHAADA